MSGLMSDICKVIGHHVVEEIMEDKKEKVEETNEKTSEINWKAVLIVAGGIICYNIGYRRGYNTSIKAVNNLIRKARESMNIQHF